MLAIKRLAGIAPEVNLGEYLTWMYTSTKHKYDCPLWLWNPEEMSPEGQKRGISGRKKGPKGPPIFFRKREIFFSDLFDKQTEEMWFL